MSDLLKQSVAEDQEFLRDCLGGPAVWSWDDEGSEDEGHPELLLCGEEDERNEGFVSMAMGDSSDEEEVEDDIDDAYRFDPEKVAEMLKAGKTSQAALVEAMQQAMADALQRRLRLEKNAGEKLVQPGLDNPYAAAELAGNTCEDDLAGRMTPPGTTFPSEETDCTGFEASPLPDRLRFAQAKAAAKARGRRSSMLRRDAISQAMKDAVSRHRRSITCRAEKPTELIQQAMASAHKRHRLSVSMAAEVVQAAEPDDEEQALEDNKKVAEQMAAVQQAMEQARRRHLRSIAEAVKTVTADPQAASAIAGDSVQDRIQLAIAAAYQRRCGGSVEALTSQQAAQDKIQQALAAAAQRNTVTAPTGWSQSHGYADVSQSYTTQTYAEPVQCYAEPVQCYAEPVQSYAEPVQSYAEPVQCQMPTHSPATWESGYGHSSTDSWSNNAGCNQPVANWGYEGSQTASQWPAGSQTASQWTAAVQPDQAISQNGWRADGWSGNTAIGNNVQASQGATQWHTDDSWCAQSWDQNSASAAGNWGCEVSQMRSTAGGHWPAAWGSA